MASNAGLDICCPVCGSDTRYQEEAPGWGEFRKCLSCDLIYANPMSLPDPAEVYNRAYRGEMHSKAENKSDMYSYLRRFLLAKAIKAASIKPEKTLKAAYREAWEYIQANIPSTSVVFDIGCAVGYFMDVIRRLGYKPYGLEVSAPLVEMLEKEGFPIWQGTIDTVPTDWVEPQVCTSFFVLHHVDDPVGFIKTIKDKFPSAILILADHNSMGGGIHLKAYPPRDLTWWGEKPLRTAMERAGYEVEMIVPKATWQDYPLHAIIPRSLSILTKLGEELSPSAFNKVYRLYLLMVKIITFPLAMLYRLKGWNTSVIAIGKPK